ncbi:MAG: type VI secretion system baseplate subunit TssG [Candidatus Latescibacteria bacterium]|nr:type VI secretion system baseplate subunit TssG [Candidatus Latescibacterota bacterium]
MAGTFRGQTPDIKRRLLKEGFRFSYIQAIRLLRYLVYGEKTSIHDKYEINRMISVHPQLSLDFPESDISSIRENGKDSSRFLVEVTFLELYGSSSPLPTFYTEDLLDELSTDKTITRDFIDILNTPVYNAYFKIWSKYRLFFNIVEQLDPDTLQRLYCLIGLENDTLQNQVNDSYGMMRYMGLLTQFPRSAEGLRSLLSDNLNEPSIRIDQCIPRIAKIPDDQRFILGVSGNALGKNGYLGNKIVDRMGKFRIQARPLDSDTFHRFLPDRPAFNTIRNLTSFYLDQQLLWDMELIIDYNTIDHARLGGNEWSQLGWSTWIYSEKPQTGNVSVVLTGQEY